MLASTRFRKGAVGMAIRFYKQVSQDVDMKFDQTIKPPQADFFNCLLGG